MASTEEILEQYSYLWLEELKVTLLVREKEAAPFEYFILINGGKSILTIEDPDHHRSICDRLVSEGVTVLDEMPKSDAPEPPL